MEAVRPPRFRLNIRGKICRPDRAEIWQETKRWSNDYYGIALTHNPGYLHSGDNEYIREH